MYKTAMKDATFTQWLRAQRKRQDAIGDLARDAAKARNWPRDVKTLSRLLRYLERQDACTHCLIAAQQAWEEYESAKPPKPIPAWALGYANQHSNGGLPLQAVS